MLKYDPRKHRCIEDIIKDFFCQFGINPRSFDESGDLDRYSFDIGLRVARDHFIPEFAQVIREFVLDNIDWRNKTLIESARSSSREQIEKEIVDALRG